MKIIQWIALLLLAIAGFSEYYVYDSLTSIDSMVKSTLGLDAADFGLTYSFYSVANVFLGALFFAGILIDYWGTKKSGLLFVSLCVLGALLTAWGAGLKGAQSSWLSTGFLPQYSAPLKVMLVGRMIFGVGAEALMIVIMKSLAHWFGNKKVAFAFALALVLYRFGTFSALNLQIKMALKYNIYVAIYFAAFVMAIGWIAFVIYIWIDHKFKPTVESLSKKEPKFKLANIAHFPISFWYIALICITFYGSITSFEIFDPDILKHKFGLSLTRSGFLSSMLLIATMILMPIFGKMIDHYGRRATLMITGSTLALLGLLWITYFQYPVVAIVFIGIAYSLIATALWATIPVIVAPHCQGSAFGILGYIQNVGLMLFPWLSGYIADLYTKMDRGSKLINYTPVLIFFIALMVVSLIFSICLKLSDRRSMKEGALSMEDLKE